MCMSSDIWIQLIKRNYMQYFLMITGGDAHRPLTSHCPPFIFTPEVPHQKLKWLTAGVK